jgi:hypothetical protein
MVKLPKAEKNQPKNEIQNLTDKNYIGKKSINQSLRHAFCHKN